MKIKLSYGRNGLDVDLPDQVQVFRSRYIPGLIDETAAIQDALRNPVQSAPLVGRVKPGEKVVIAHSDITRATPNHRLLPVIIHELEDAGIRSQDITLVNGLGTHRFQTATELRQLLGVGIYDHYRCIQHDAYNDSVLIPIGLTAFGNDVRVNKTYLEADVRILTGFIEPHLFAGFSGGPKAVLPALSGFESVSTNHSVENIANPKAIWGVTEGNPILEEMKEVALKTQPTFLVNVTLNIEKQITGVFAGELTAAHRLGCDFVGQNAMVPVREPFDIVITTNSGYPLDQNLYQSVKGIRAAHMIVKKGGAIICATACEEGLPDYGGYSSLLKRGGSPQGILEMVNTSDFFEHDMWQVQIQAMVQSWADVYIYSQGLTVKEIEESLFFPCLDIAHTLKKLQAQYGSDASVAVIPDGPQTIPFLDPSPFAYDRIH